MESVTESPSAGEDPTSNLNLLYIISELAIAVLAAGGNGLVCVAVLRTRQLRTVTNFFLVSLAVADVFVGLVAIPCAILTDQGLPRNQFLLCLFMLSSIITFTQSSIFSLLAVAIERYVAIFNPLRYQAIMTPHNAIIIIVITWVISLVIGLVPALGWNKGPPQSGLCLFVPIIDMSYMVYFNFFGCVLFPLLIMFAIYARIFAQVRWQLRRIATERHGNAENREGNKAMSKDVKTAISLFLVLFLFTVCWVPLHIINCLILLCPICQIPLPILSTAIILSHANSAVNPIFYALRMRSFRQAFVNILLGGRRSKKTQIFPTSGSSANRATN
uniref:adenosine receptor A2a-like n=1 Tax=Myxine glutinosa TaxID=7769 RepID=UPI00358F00D0